MSTNDTGIFKRICWDVFGTLVIVFYHFRLPNVKWYTGYVSRLHYGSDLFCRKLNNTRQQVQRRGVSARGRVPLPNK